jgi:predicted metalloprotease with PDZ domain
VALLLDLEIRRRTANRNSLDDVLRLLWKENGQSGIGFAPGRFEQLASQLAGADLSSFFESWLRRPGDLDFTPQLNAAGLALMPAHQKTSTGANELPSNGNFQEVRVGFQFKFEAGKTIIGSVLIGTPASKAGLNAGDELIALDGFRVDAMCLGLRLQGYAPGSKITLTVFRREELLNLTMMVEFTPPTRLAIRPLSAPSPDQKRMIEDWLREDPNVMEPVNITAPSSTA